MAVIDGHALFDEVNETVTDWVNRQDDRPFAEAMVALRDRWAGKIEAGERTRKMIGQLVARADAGELSADDAETLAVIHETSRRFRDEGQDLARSRSIHERHVNLLEGCPLCELEAAHQRDRLACNMCGEPLDPSQPFDGHRDCREQE